MRTLLAALAAAVLLAACASTPAGDGAAQDGAAQDDAAQDEAGGPDAEDAGGAPAGGPELAIEPTPDAGPAPDSSGTGVLAFTAPTVDGGQLDASSLEGRDVVLWFWAPW
jgi:hypothetical protein